MGVYHLPLQPFWYLPTFISKQQPQFKIKDFPQGLSVTGSYNEFMRRTPKMLAFSNCSLSSCMEEWRHETLFLGWKQLYWAPCILYLLAMTEASSHLCSVPHCQHQNMTPLFYFVLASEFFYASGISWFEPTQIASSSLAPSPTFI